MSGTKSFDPNKSATGRKEATYDTELKRRMDLITALDREYTILCSEPKYPRKKFLALAEKFTAANLHVSAARIRREAGIVFKKKVEDPPGYFIITKLDPKLMELDVMLTKNRDYGVQAWLLGRLTKKHDRDLCGICNRPVGKWAFMPMTNLQNRDDKICVKCYSKATGRSLK